MNKLLRAVEDYLDDEREYVRFAEREIQVLEQKARDERRQTQRRMIAALYWRAGEALMRSEAAHARWSAATDSADRERANRAADKHDATHDETLRIANRMLSLMEAACPR